MARNSENIAAAIEAVNAIISDQNAALKALKDTLSQKAAVTTSITDDIVTTAFSASNAGDVYNGLSEIIPSDAKYVLFVLNSSFTDVANNQLLCALFPNLIITSQDRHMLYVRWRDGNYNSNCNTSSIYDLVVNTGDEYRMIAIK